MPTFRLSACCITLLIITEIYLARLLKVNMAVRNGITALGFINPLWSDIHYDMYSCLGEKIHQEKKIGEYTCSRWCCIRHKDCYHALMSTRGCTSEDTAVSFTTLHRSFNCNNFNGICGKGVCQCDIDFLQCTIDCIYY